MVQKIISLNAGCGDHYVDNWINVDVVARHRVDVRADLAALPLDTGSARRIFACHLLEHLEFGAHLPAVLAEFHRVLADDGELCVVGPDIERAVALGEPARLLRAIIAWPLDFNHGGWEAMSPPTGHAWTATGPLVQGVLTAAGFAWTSVTGRLHQLADADWPLANFADWQHGYLCTKGAP